jgi:hypothetical protein
MEMDTKWFFFNTISIIGWIKYGRKNHRMNFPKMYIKPRNLTRMVNITITIQSKKLLIGIGLFLYI